MEIKEIDKQFIRFGYENSGISCVLSLFLYFNRNIAPEKLQEKLLLDEKGKTTLADIATVFEDFGLVTEGFQADSVSNLDELTNPAIILVYLEDGHREFAVYYGKYANKYLIGIPFWGLNLYADWELEAIWYNYILLEVKKF
ncbi:hypothetical protein FACS1894182_02230 [Bacteroidia bacterium]|nr:hypothetical protein FACS1894182_02230 [Bacteroidia bacterium]